MWALHSSESYLGTSLTICTLAYAWISLRKSKEVKMDGRKRLQNKDKLFLLNSMNGK